MIHNLVMYSKLPSEISFSLVIVPLWYSNTHPKKKKKVPFGIVKSHRDRVNRGKLTCLPSKLCENQYDCILFYY